MQVALKTKKLSLIFNANLLALILTFVVAGFFYLTNFIKRSRENEAKDHLNGVYTAEKNWKGGSGRFSKSIKEAGYYPQMKDTEFYTETEQVPLEIKYQLTEISLPYVKDDSYKILLVMKRHGIQTFWTINERQEITKIGESTR